ncbi:MAG: hypothetical protein LBV04_08105 [Deferribacteraceae bacterium]|jgi:hypothetical protein|nr:hypothetical protein [Deferribacteraceae bacterium]
MSENPKLDEAIAIFKKLGWESVTAENILQLPIGTAEERRIALAGLKSGDWSDVNVNRGALALFAIRIGINGLHEPEWLSVQMECLDIEDTKDPDAKEEQRQEMLVAAIADRGVEFAAKFVAWSIKTQLLWNIDEAIMLVDRLNLDIPQNVNYIGHWAFYVTHNLSRKEESPRRVAIIKRRFKEHIAVGVTLKAPDGKSAELAIVPIGVERGWLERSEAIDMAIIGLDAASHPSNRKLWLDLLDELAISDSEIAAHTDTLIPILATGDQYVLNRLVPTLIANAKGAQLAELLIASFSVKTKKGKQLVLKAALKHKHIDDEAAGLTLASWLEIFANDAEDRATAKLAQQLIVQWNIKADIKPIAPAKEAVEIKPMTTPFDKVWLDNGGVVTTLYDEMIIVTLKDLGSFGKKYEYSSSRVLQSYIASKQICAETIRRAMHALLKIPTVSPAKLMRPLEGDLDKIELIGTATCSFVMISVLWPMLTESIKAAGTETKPPVWVNSVLDAALSYAPYLKEAASRGLIPAEDAKWQGLSAIAASKSKSAAVDKAKQLLVALELQS